MTTDNTLLIRIDERQKEMARDIANINKKLEGLVTEDKCKERQNNFNKEFLDIRSKTSILWDDRNKVIGYVVGGGMVGGGISALLTGAVKTIMAYF